MAKKKTPKPITKPTSEKLIGLNIYRAVAIFMMMAAHSIRVQENFSTIFRDRDNASLFDRFLLIFIDIEPIISALFLFIAGFSLTLSYARLKNPERKNQWFIKICQRAAWLYGIAVLFFVAEYGFQWPDMLVSAGVLGTIALSIVLSAALLLYGYQYKGLSLATLVCLMLSYVLESQHWQITGLNAGAGGHIPLIVMGFIGTLFGLAYTKYGDNGLFSGLAISMFIALVAFAVKYPNTFVYKSQFTIYSTEPIEQAIQAFLSLFSTIEASQIIVAGFWNHASIYPLRFTAIIAFFLILAIKLIRNGSNPLIKFLDALGSYGLTIYVFHLVVLAGVEVSGFKPHTGWQTLLLILMLMATGYGIIKNRFRIDPDTQ